MRARDLNVKKKTPKQTQWSWSEFIGHYRRQEQTVASDCVAEMQRLSKEAALWERFGYYESELVLIDRENCKPCVQPRGE